MCRRQNVPVEPADTTYCMVNVFDPELTVTDRAFMSVS
jgi:hypothetical protein